MWADLMAVGKNKDLSYAKDEVDVRLADGTEIRARAALGGYMGPTESRPYPDFVEVVDDEREALLIEMDADDPKTMEAALMAGDSHTVALAPLVIAQWPSDDGSPFFTMVVKNRAGLAGVVRVVSARPGPRPEATIEDELDEARNHITSLLRREDVSATDRVTDEEAARRWLSAR